MDDINSNPIIKTIVKILTPIIILISLYIHAHGEVSPGGGFQAGAIAASVFALQLLTRSGVNKFTNLSLLRILSSVGVGVYVIVGLTSLLLGSEYLNYSIFFPSIPFLGQKVGIFFVELGIAITVFSTFSLILFSLHRELK